nr:MAG TPA: Epidermal growth factor receptor substrate [Caudoviricetes sp.]
MHYLTKTNPFLLNLSFFPPFRRGPLPIDPLYFYFVSAHHN